MDTLHAMKSIAQSQYNHHEKYRMLSELQDKVQSWETQEILELIEQEMAYLL